MANQISAVRETLGHLALAPFDGNHWTPALRAMCAATNGHVSQLLCQSAETTGTVVNLASEELPVQEWLRAGGADPSINPYIAGGQRLKVGQDFADFEILSTEERQRHPLVGEYYRVFDVPHVCVSKLLETPAAAWFVVTLRAATQGPIMRCDRTVFRRLARYSATAVRQSRALKGDAVSLLAGALSAVSLVAFVCDGFGRVVATTEKAERLLQSGSLLHCVNARLSARTARETVALDSAILSSISEFGGADDRAGVPLTNAAGLVHSAQVIRLPPDRNDIGFGAAALVVIEEPVDKRAQLVKSFRLTNAEAIVAQLLARGLNAAEISALRAVSSETVRSQCKSIYAKTQVRRQSELVALLSRAHWDG